MIPTPPSPQLRSADGIAWAVLFIFGILSASITALFFLFWITAQPLDGQPVKADIVITFIALTALLTLGPLAFHRRKWWAWDLALSLITTCLINFPAYVLIKMVDPNRSPSLIVLAPPLLLGAALSALATRTLLHSSVRAAFPAPLPNLPITVRVVASWMAVNAIFSIIETLSHPLTATTIPIFLSFLYSGTAYSLYTLRRDATIVALAAYSLGIYNAFHLPTPSTTIIALSILAALIGTTLLFLPPSRLN